MLVSAVIKAHDFSPRRDSLIEYHCAIAGSFCPKSGCAEMEQLNLIKELPLIKLNSLLFSTTSIGGSWAERKKITGEKVRRNLLN
ncbi:hypothetical protein XBP1_1080014 [Xenorhabdus bovienii str. puntauvense]|uniref:Uncharacterized protein n=1 Tax=Xenorhabdus bovienii str. puntauvense TaxID=1398201 RepID=A0A077MZE6_XENBV|nr:hypothetical protein XBP1_1080014 [Xenorhabdus bovienii str. puntauvense]